MLATFLQEIKDFRRPQGQRYTLYHTLLFSFMAIYCNANTYVQIGEFIKTNFAKLSHYFDLDWLRAPHHTMTAWGARFFIPMTSCKNGMAHTKIKRQILEYIITS